MHQFNIYDFSVSFLNYDSNLILSFVIFDNFLSEWYQHLLKKWKWNIERVIYYVND